MLFPSRIRIAPYSKDRSKYELDVSLRSVDGKEIRKRVVIPPPLMSSRSKERVRLGHRPTPDSTAGRWIHASIQKWQAEALETFVSTQITSQLAPLAAEPTRSTRVPKPRSKCPTLAEFEDTFKDGYLSSIRARPSTRKNYDTTFRNHLVPVFGKMRLDEIDKRAIEPLLCRPGLAASTTNNVIHALKSVLKYARDLGHVAEIPEIKRLREEQRKTEDEKWWTRPELNAILRVGRERSLQDYIFALLGAHAGLRVSEIIMLLWLDVDFEKRMLFIRRNLSANCETTPKGKRARSIPMTDQLRTALLELAEEHGTTGHVLKGETGDRWTKGMAEWSILKSSRLAGVSEGRPHKLRHTCGSLLGRDGWTAKQIAYFLGHSNPATAEKYIHTHRDDLTGMAGSLDAPKKQQ